MTQARPTADICASRLVKKVVQASHDYRLIEPNDKILVAISGGKDSHVMLHVLECIRRRAPFPFSLVVLNIDQGQPGFPKDILPKYFADQGYQFIVVTEDTYSVVRAKTPPGKTSCSMCSRLRRGILYTQARRLGATKIALGHHRDDLVETLLLNLFFAGQIKSMPARLQADDGYNVVIRPLVYCSEHEIAEFAELMGFPIVPCSLCSNQPSLQRQRIKELLAHLGVEHPHISNSLAAALKNVKPSHLLDMDLLETYGRVTPQAGAVDIRLHPNGSVALPIIDQLPLDLDE